MNNGDMFLDVNVNLKITESEALTGCKKIVTAEIVRNGVKEKKKYEVTVPVNIKNGQTIRLKGAGCVQGYNRGNLMVTVVIQKRHLSSIMNQRIYMLLRSKRWKKYVLLTFAVIVSMFGVFYYNKSQKPSEEWIKDNIPNELLQYKFSDLLGSECYISNVDNIQIERRVTEHGIDDAYCVVTLKDENVSRTIYVELISRKYDAGGWFLESWNEYNKEEGVITKEFDEGYLRRYFTEILGYSDVTNINCSGDLQQGTLSCDVDENYEYIDVWSIVKQVDTIS